MRISCPAKSAENPGRPALTLDAQHALELQSPESSGSGREALVLRGIAECLSLRRPPRPAAPTPTAGRRRPPRLASDAKKVFNRFVIVSASLWAFGLAAALACVAWRRLAFAWLCLCAFGLTGWALAGGAGSAAFWVALAVAFGLSLAASHPGLAEAALERPLRAWFGGERARWPAPRFRWEAELTRDCPDWSVDPRADRDPLPPPEARPEWLLPAPTVRGELAERAALGLRAWLPTRRLRRSAPRGPHARAFDAGLARWRWAARWWGAHPGRRPHLEEAHSWLLHGSRALRAGGPEPDARARWESELALRRSRAALERALAWEPRSRWARPLAGLWRRWAARCVRAPERSPALEAELAAAERARPLPAAVELPDHVLIPRPAAASRSDSSAEPAGERPLPSPPG